MHFDVLAANGRIRRDEATKGGAVEDGVELRKDVQRLPGGFREGLHRWNEEQQGNDGWDDHRHGPDEALDVCFVVYHDLFVEGPELLDGF